MPHPDLRATPLASIVGVAPVLTSTVQLRGSLWTRDPESHAAHLDRFVPTKSGREALLGVLSGTKAGAYKRVHFLTGSYGTGKSYLLLVLASLLGLRLDDSRLSSLLGRIRKGEETYADGLAREIATASKVENERKAGYGYLVVVPEYADREYDRALLNALREALGSANLDFPFPTEFAEAQRVLAGWKADWPNFIDRLVTLLAPKGESVERLQRQLEEHDGEALARFGVLFEDITGAPYRAARVSLEETFDQTSRFLQKQGYRSIAVLFDEFGLFLQEAGSGNAGQAVAAVQSFMEFARKRPGADIQLVLAAHRGLADYGTGEEGREEMKKMAGRLEATYRLSNSTEHREAETMIAGAFIVPEDEDAEARKAALARLRDLARAEDWVGHAAAWYGGAETAWIQQTLVEGAYPLHPAVMLALPSLSDDVGQHKRTMFRFLAPGEPGGADAFIRQSSAETDAGRPALLTLADLFDYFVATAEKGAAAGRAADALAEYSRARATLRDPGALAERALKTIAVIQLLGDPRLQATADTLRWALHLQPSQADDIATLLNVLVAQDALRQNQNTKIYSFRSAGGTSTDAIFNEEKRKLSPLSPEAVLNIIREARAPDAYTPYDYNDRKKTNRRVAADYVVPGAEAAVIELWQSCFERIHEKGDAKSDEGNLVVLYGLADDEAGRDRLERALRRASEAPTVIAAVAASPTPLAALALNVATAKAALGRKDVQADENAISEFGQLVQQHGAALAAILDRALSPSQFAWYAGGERRHEPDTLRRKLLAQFLDDVVEKAFPDTPVIASDVVQEYPDRNIGGRRKEREQAIDRLLQPVPFSMQGASAVDAVLQGLLRPNDMFEEQGIEKNERVGKVVAPPEGAPAAAAWRALEDTLLASKNPRQERSIARALSVLHSPPFGLSYPAAQVFLGAFVATRREAFELRDAKNRQHALSGEALIAACQKKGFKLVHQAITSAERALLDRVASIISRKGLPDPDHPLGPWAAPAARLATWYDELPALTRKNAPGEDDDVKALLEALGGYRGRRDDEQARGLLTEALPKAFSVDPVGDTSTLEGFARRLGAAIESASGFAEDYAEKVFVDVAYKAFDKKVVSGSAEFEQCVNAWRDGLTPAAKQHEFGGPTGALLKTLLRASTASVTERFLTALPRDWEMVPFRGWRHKKQRTEYVEAFRDAVREVQAWQSDPLRVLRRLHSAVFEESASEHATEADIDADFKAWLRELPEATSSRIAAGGFGEVASALAGAIRGNGSVEERYLEALPSAFSQAAGPWKNWGQVAENDVVLGTADAVRKVSIWTPPLSADGTAKTLLARLGWPAEAGATPHDALDTAAATWFAGLAPATQRHDFIGLAGAIVKRLREGDGIADGLAEDLPRTAALPPLGEADDATAATELAERIAQAVSHIEAWRRLPLEVLRLASERSLADASAFTLGLSEWVQSLPHTPTPDGLSAPAAALLSWSRAGLAWRPAFARFAETAGLGSRVHTWSPADDAAFTKAVAAARAELEAWTPPPVDPARLRAAVADALRAVLRSTGATVADVHSVLFKAASDLEA